ncbi:MAG: GGDEF domain-containing protein [Chitinophagales bacterium]
MPVKNSLKEFFTSIGANRANRDTLRTTARARLFVLFPLLFIFTFISIMDIRAEGPSPQAVTLILTLLSVLAVVYLSINLAMAFNLTRPSKTLTYISIFIELIVNQIVLYLSGSLTSHAVMFIIVAIAVYRVFLDYWFALYTACLGGAIFILTAVLEINQVIPLSIGLNATVIHPVYSNFSLMISVIGAVLLGIFVTFVSINYGMNQVLKLNRRLEKLSILDGLTGISNRRSFDHHLTIEWQRAMRYRTPLSLIMIDIDCFKAYNDNYGHLSGDCCLHRVAQELHGLARRPTDMVARYGGEEFAVLLPDTSLEGASSVAEAMRAQIESVGIAHDFSQPNNYVTLSLGVATVIPSSSSNRSLVEYADKALYQAKRKGRNRVELYPAQTISAS